MNPLPWGCNFEKDDDPYMCGFMQDESSDFNWRHGINGTDTPDTGPPESSFEEYGTGTDIILLLYIIKLCLKGIYRRCMCDQYQKLKVLISNIFFLYCDIV